MRTYLRTVRRKLRQRMSPSETPGPPSGFEEIIGFAKSDEVLFVFDTMLEVPSTERGRGEVNLSPKQGQTLRLRVGG